MKTIGERIRAARKARGYTLSELADRYQKHSGGIISAKTISAWERGEKRIYADIEKGWCNLNKPNKHN